MPAVNVSESDQEFRISAELPGMDENDIELLLSQGNLTIKGEKKQEHEDKGSGYYRLERNYGTFQRSIPLPKGVDTEQVDATFKKGVLTVTLPKIPELQSDTRKVTIKTEEK
jgi:HSP20 family protein